MYFERTIVQNRRTLDEGGLAASVHRLTCDLFLRLILCRSLISYLYASVTILNARRKKDRYQSHNQNLTLESRTRMVQISITLLAPLFSSSVLPGSDLRRTCHGINRRNMRLAPCCTQDRSCLLVRLQCIRHRGSRRREFA